MTSFPIHNSVAFITGTNKKNGLGRALVQELIARGASKIYATARSVDQLADLVSEHASKVVPVALDVTDEKATARLGERYPEVNLLINNAGVLKGSGALDDAELAVTEIAVNYLAPLRITRSFAPRLEARQHSAIVNINSIASLINFSLGGTYSASKAASHSLTQAQRRELPKTLVVGVYPGPIDTEMAREVPMDKVQPREVARAIVDALQSGQEDVYPDPVAKQMLSAYQSDAKGVELQMAGRSEAAE